MPPTLTVMAIVTPLSIPASTPRLGSHAFTFILKYGAGAIDHTDVIDYDADDEDYRAIHLVDMNGAVGLILIGRGKLGVVGSIQ